MLQPTLSRLRIVRANIELPVVLNALVDALLPRRLHTLDFLVCTSPAPAPLVRLLRSFTLTHMSFLCTYTDRPMLDEAGAALVADALSSNTTLQVLELRSARLCFNVPAACVLLRGLVGHPTLRELELGEEDPQGGAGAAVGAALAALVNADTPALHTLRLRALLLGTIGLAPIMDALPHNHHLRALDIRRTGGSEAFSRNRMLPAVRANTLLRALQWRASMWRLPPPEYSR